jgi:hypothetical protein
MKLTDPPFATVSIRRSLKAERMDGEGPSGLIDIADMV